MRSCGATSPAIGSRQMTTAEFYVLLAQLRDAGRFVASSGGDLARLLGLPIPINFRAVRSLLDLIAHLEDAPAVDATWLTHGVASRLSSTADDAKKGHVSLGDGTRKFAKEFAVPIDDVRADLPDEIE